MIFSAEKSSPNAQKVYIKMAANIIATLVTVIVSRKLYLPRVRYSSIMDGMII